MNILLIGSGGREHALAWKLSQSPRLTKLLIAPGNPGMAQFGQIVPVDVTRIDLLIDIAVRSNIDLVIIGPEAPLAAGLADACLAAGLRVFGPTAAAAQIESSKAFAKQLMLEAGIPTAQVHIFTDSQQAADFARASQQIWVVKADQLAAGKGVIIPNDQESMLAAIRQISAMGAERILLEERLTGPEISLLALCDGERLLVLPPAHDHKRLLDGDKGPNTGGMGAIAPAALDREAQQWIVERCMFPAVRALAAAGTPFCGVLYAGLMLTPDGPYVLEYNARFGDPETQVILPLLAGDLLEALLACAEGQLSPDMLTWNGGAAACVVVAAPGYPEDPQLGIPIQGIESIEQPGVIVFHAGTAWDHGQLVTAGGRVLCITGTATTLERACELAYLGVELIQFPGMQYRSDIGSLDS